MKLGPWDPGETAVLEVLEVVRVPGTDATVGYIQGRLLEF